MSKKDLRDRDGLTEAEFLAAYRPGNWPHPAVTVDLLLFSLEREQPELLMVRRGNHPWLGCWALPGGFVEPGENTAHAAARELREECSLSGIPLAELGLFSDPGRDPRDWTMSDAFAAVVDRSALSAAAGDDAADVGWFSVHWTLESGRMDLTLTRGEEELSARMDAERRMGAFGPTWSVGNFTCDGIACDHGKMIALALLKLQEAGRL